MSRLIPESEYRSVLDSRKGKLRQLVILSGLSQVEIADAAGVERRVVKRVLDGDAVRYDTAIRMEYFLERYCREHRR